MGMELQNSFVVDVPIADAWDFFMDPVRVVPCMPGAKLVKAESPTDWTVKAGVKLGSVKMNFKANVKVAEADKANWRAVLKADGKEVKGKGNVKASIISVLEETDSGGTKVSITTDMTISGKAAQFARGMVPDVADKFTGDFAEAMEYQLKKAQGEDAEKEAEAAAAAAAKAAEEAAAAAAAIQAAAAAEEAAAAAPSPSESPAEAPVAAAVDLSELQALVAKAERAAALADASAKQVNASALQVEAAAKRIEAAAAKAELANRKEPDGEVNTWGMMVFMVKRWFGRLFGGGSSAQSAK